MTSMPHTTSPRHDEVVLGVDTHKDVHVAVVLTRLGVLVEGRSFPATAAGYSQMIAWAQSLGHLRQAGVEGTGSYGASLARALKHGGVDVMEVNRPDRAARRRHGKSDLIDAEAAARSVLAGKATATPKTGDGIVESMRMLKMTKSSAVKAKVQAINQLKSILVNANPTLREQLSPLGVSSLVRRCAELDPAGHSGVTATAMHTLQRLARRIQYLAGEIRDLEKQLTAAVRQTAPELLQVRGIGPDSAATLLIAAGDNPHRLRTEASFAALCGVSPVQASSGKTQRHRLNRGGHRQANAALWRAVATGLRWDTKTQDYMQRRTTEGLSKLETMRCLKRYMARIVYRIICNAIPTSA